MLEKVNWERLLEFLHDGVYCVDPERRITYWNHSAEEITGYAAGEVMGHRCSSNILMHMDLEGNSLCLGHCPLAAAMADGQTRAAEVYLHHKAGHRVPVSVRVAPVHDSAGVVVGGIELFTDVSAKHSMLQRMQELEALTLVDTLTGLSNRIHLERELDARLEETERYGVPFGLLFLDVDHFKGFNDRFGHGVGDRALQTVGTTLKLTARPFDVFGRWGGEEFLGIIRNIEGASLCHMANRVRRLIAGSLIDVGGRMEQVTVSIGATLVRPGDDPATLVRRADQLMYQSKEAGRNCVTCDFDS